MPGEEKQASGRCVQCLQGFYKDNDLGLFSMCMACPENYTTLTVGASKAAQCSISELSFSMAHITKTCPCNIQLLKLKISLEKFW